MTVVARAKPCLTQFTGVLGLTDGTRFQAWLALYPKCAIVAEQAWLARAVIRRWLRASWAGYAQGLIFVGVLSCFGALGALLGSVANRTDCTLLAK